MDRWHFTYDGRLNHVNNTITRDYCFEYQYNEDLTERSDIVLRCSQKFSKLKPNIARGTTDPGIASIT